MQTTAPPRWTIRSSEDLGRAIAGVREARGMTQEQLARATDVNRSYLAMLEAGSGALVIERALRALRRMGATVTVTLPDGDVAA
jgi:transcriptional regulator with XRE-family HTH domain